MLRRDANRVALKVMRDHLEVAWYSSEKTNRLTLRGVLIRNALAQALMDAHEQGEYDERTRQQEEL